MKKVTQMAAKVVAKVALSATTAGANSTCSWILHQEKFPESAKKLKK